MKFKHTKIVQHLDQCSRIYLPSEIYNRYNIKKGDPLEISYDEGCIILKPYQQHLILQKRYIQDMYAIFDCACMSERIKASICIFDSQGNPIQSNLSKTKSKTPKQLQNFITSNKDIQTSKQNNKVTIYKRFKVHQAISKHNLTLYAAVDVTFGNADVVNTILQTMNIAYRRFLHTLPVRNF